VIIIAEKYDSICLLCESFLPIKKEKGGESMKIKVNVRAGAVSKNR